MLDEWRRAQGAKQSQRQRQAGELVYKTYGQQPQDEIKKQLDAEAVKLREEIAGLRIDTVVGRSVLRGEINDLMKKKTRA